VHFVKGDFAQLQASQAVEVECEAFGRELAQARQRARSIVLEEALERSRVSTPHPSFRIQSEALEQWGGLERGHHRLDLCASMRRSLDPESHA
jgi:predicted transcriptional regulator